MTSHTAKAISDVLRYFGPMTGCFLSPRTMVNNIYTYIIL